MAVIVAAGVSDAVTYRMFGRYIMRIDRLFQPAAESDGVGAVSVFREDSQKFIASVAGGKTFRTCGIGKQGGKVFDENVTGVVPKSVIGEF